MRNSHRLAAAGIAIAAAVSLAACSGGSSTSANSATTTSAMPATSSEAPAAEGGVTTVKDTFGPACGKIPSDGAGSLNGMATDPVATAASHNPLLTKLVAAVTAAKLGDTLNSQKAITVFAPYDGAFTMSDADFAALAKDTAKLSKILTYHVVPKRLTADQLVKDGSETTLEGGTVKVTGDKSAGIMVNDAPVLCGNIPTANATVYVIGKLLSPTS